MKGLAVVLLVLAVSASAYDVRARFESFKTQFGKTYESSELEAHRFNVFMENMRKADALNADEGAEVHGVTKFSDLTASEFKRHWTGFKPLEGQAAIDRTKMPVHVSKRAFAPNTTSFDWRMNGAITPVKDQGQCGSCWAFSTIQEVESAWFLAGHPLPILSPQQVVSCDKGGGDQGCNGGDTVSAYKYVTSAGLESEKSYPYTSGNSGSDGQCKYNKANVVSTMTKFTYATPPCFDACTKQDEDTLATNLATTGPASICVYAESWQTYTGGILSSNCPRAYSALDHCVHLVGFNTNTQGVKYWIVKNSWSSDWGNGGYIYVKFGSNLCGIADEATFVETQ